MSGLYSRSPPHGLLLRRRWAHTRAVLKLMLVLVLMKHGRRPESELTGDENKAEGGRSLSGAATQTTARLFAACNKCSS